MNWYLAACGTPGVYVCVCVRVCNKPDAMKYLLNAPLILTLTSQETLLRHTHTYIAHEAVGMPLLVESSKEVLSDGLGTHGTPRRKVLQVVEPVEVHGTLWISSNVQTHLHLIVSLINTLLKSLSSQIKP